MKRKNLSAKKIIHNFYLEKLKNPKIRKIYFKFKKNLKKYKFNKFCVALSGGSDSLALAFLSKCFSIEENTQIYFCTVDHKLRPESSREAKKTRKNLKKFGINCETLNLVKKNINSNIQSKARKGRYDLIIQKCNKKKITFILTGHHKNDLYENFFIRLFRGSGLKGLSSFSKTKSNLKKNNNVHILRPLLNVSKNELFYITKNTFNFHINDPSNENEIFLRIRLRNLIDQSVKEGLSFKKLKQTIDNLHSTNESIEFYVNKNIILNSKYFTKRKTIIINEEFFKQPNEIVLRSLNELIIKIGNKSNFTRGRKLTALLNRLKSRINKLKFTLSGCIIEKINKSVIIYPEN